MSLGLPRVAARFSVFGLALLGMMIPVRADNAVSYTHDRVGRLTSALYGDGQCIAYSYDAAGNRTSQTLPLSGAPPSPVWGSGVWGCFSWTP